VEEYIIRLKISVHDVVFIENLESLKKLFEDKESLFFLDNLLFSKHALESSPIAILVDKVKIVLSLEHVIVSDDVIIFLYVCQNVYLMNRALF
jgi:hypothetical protein